MLRKGPSKHYSERRSLQAEKPEYTNTLVLTHYSATEVAAVGKQMSRQVTCWAVPHRCHNKAKEFAVEGLGSSCHQKRQIYS